MCSGMSADLQNSPLLLFPILGPRLPCAQADMLLPDEAGYDNALHGMYRSTLGWKGKWTVKHGRHENETGKLVLDLFA
jgi:hypothetical protein